MSREQPLGGEPARRTMSRCGTHAGPGFAHDMRWVGTSVATAFEARPIESRPEIQGYRSPAGRETSDEWALFIDAP